MPGKQWPRMNALCLAAPASPLIHAQSTEGISKSMSPFDPAISFNARHDDPRSVFWCECAHPYACAAQGPRLTVPVDRPAHV